MVMEINVIPVVKVKIETVVRDVTPRGLNVFDVRVWDIKLMSAQVPLSMEIGGRYWTPPTCPQGHTTKYRSARDVGKYQQTGSRIWVSQP